MGIRQLRSRQPGGAAAVSASATVVPLVHIDAAVIEEALEMGVRRNWDYEEDEEEEEIEEGEEDHLQLPVGELGTDLE